MFGRTTFGRTMFGRTNSIRTTSDRITFGGTKVSQSYVCKNKV
jgi:hypothetical protein